MHHSIQECPGFLMDPYASIEADDGSQRHLTPIAVRALASADAVIHDTGICKAIIDLVKPPQYLEAAGPEWAIKRSIKLARDHWRVVHLVAGNAAGGAVECATRYAEQCIPFSIMSNTYSPLDDDGPLVLLLVHKLVSLGLADPRALRVFPAATPNAEAPFRFGQYRPALGYSMSGLAG